MKPVRGDRSFDYRATKNNYGRCTKDAYRTVPKQNIVIWRFQRISVKLKKTSKVIQKEKWKYRNWYLYVYILVILIYPLLKAFVEYLDADTKRTKIFLIGTFVFLVINDISSNSLAAFSHHSINALVPASIEIILVRFV